MFLSKHKAIYSNSESIFQQFGVICRAAGGPKTGNSILWANPSLPAMIFFDCWQSTLTLKCQISVGSTTEPDECKVVQNVCMAVSKRTVICEVLERTKVFPKCVMFNNLYEMPFCLHLFSWFLTLFCSSSASANSFLMLASDSPTYLFRISGPLTTFGSLAFSILPIWRAIRVLPQPGGPNNKIPFTCLQPAERERGCQV